MIDRILSTLAALSFLGIVVMSVVMAASFWAMDKSRERTACYRAAITDCQKPGTIERAIAWINGVPYPD